MSASLSPLNLEGEKCEQDAADNERDAEPGEPVDTTADQREAGELEKLREQAASGDPSYEETQRVHLFTGQSVSCSVRPPQKGQPGDWKKRDMASQATAKAARIRIHTTSW